MATAVRKRGRIAAATVTSLVIIITATALILSSVRAHVPVHHDFGKEVAVGIDVSEHNGDIDWKKVKKQVDFAFIRVGYMGYTNGNITEDKNARKNMQGAEKAGIPYGVYIYSQAIDAKEARKEADFVLKIIKHYNPELPVMIDFEYATDARGNRTGRLYNAHLSAQENNEIIKSFFDRMEEKGYLYGVYASSSVACMRMSVRKFPSKALLWIADYNGEVTYSVPYDVWQYSCTSQCDGVESDDVDFNYWYSSRR